MLKDELLTLRERLPEDVQLVAVSKFHPAEKIREAYEAGQRIFAESRPQELAVKVPQLPADIQWHFIGHLQTNKLKLVLPHVTLVQSVDSQHLLEAISRWGEAAGKRVDILLELHLGAEETKQGFTEAELVALAECCHGMPGEAGHDERGLSGVRIRGLMGMATNTDDEAIIEADFAHIQALFHRLQPLFGPAFNQLSIGMSADWPIAVRHGATMVRIGTDIFGPREY